MNCHRCEEEAFFLSRSSGLLQFYADDTPIFVSIPFPVLCVVWNSGVESVLSAFFVSDRSFFLLFLIIIIIIIIIIIMIIISVSSSLSSVHIGGPQNAVCSLAGYLFY